GEVGTQGGDGRGRLVQGRPEDRHLRVLAKRRLAGERLVEDAAQRVDVRAAIDGLALDLLRGDVVDRAHEVSRVGQRALFRRVRGKAEVAQIDVVRGIDTALARDQDVAGFDVPAEEPTRKASGVERARHLSEDAEGASQLEPAFPHEQSAQVVRGMLDRSSSGCLTYSDFTRDEAAFPPGKACASWPSAC